MARATASGVSPSSSPAAHRHFGAILFHIAFPGCTDPQSKLLDGTADLNGAPVPKQLFDFSQNHRHRISGKAYPPGLIKTVTGFYQAHTSCTVEVIVFDAPPRKRPAQLCTSPRFFSIKTLRRVLSDTINLPPLLISYVSDVLAASCLVITTLVPRAGWEVTFT